MKGIVERFWAKVDRNGPASTHRPDLGACWMWSGAIETGGYGCFRNPPKTTRAHRYAYELLVGPIPEGLDLDHLCRVRNCVNPAHLEPVTHRENVLRGDGLPAIAVRRTQCIHGHPFDEANTIRLPSEGMVRRCRECRRLNAAKQNAKHRAQQLAVMG